MKNLIISVFIVFLLTGSAVFSQNAPVCTIQEVVTNGLSATVDITVTDFNNVGSCNVQLLYDPDAVTCSGATLGAGIAGGLATNVTAPGVITIGWYSWPGVTISDNSVFFTLQFSNISNGFTAITWDATYADKQWSDGDFEVLNDTPESDYYSDGSLFFESGNAPVTTALHVVGDPGTDVDVPVTVTAFNNIGSLDLTLDFDHTVLSYLSFTNNSGFPSLSINETVPGTLAISGFIGLGLDGIFLPENATLLTLTFHFNGGNSDLSWNNSGIACQYKDSPAFSVLNDDPTANYYQNGSVGEATNFNLTVFLEGAYASGGMTAGLVQADLLANDQPYSASPWNYPGTESVTVFPLETVDWILVEIRESTGDASSATSDKTIFRKAGLLLQNGRIKDLDGSSDLAFSITSQGNVYVVVYHRNHVPVISANALIINGGNAVYDFSSGENQVLGGAAAHKQLAGGTWALASGDSNGDGDVNLTDQSLWTGDAGESGYLLSDYSLDGNVNNSDKNDLWLDNQGEKSSQVPD